MKHCRFFILSLSLLTACATNHDSAIRSSQTWPTTQGAMSDSTHAVLLYRSWPERPYRVIDRWQFAQNPGAWKDADTTRAAQVAKAKGGDAIILRFAGEFEPGINPNSAPDPRAFSSNVVSVLVIKWKSPSELAGEKQALERFRVRFLARHPGMELPNELLAMGAEYCAYLGLSPALPAGAAQLEADLNELLLAPTNAPASKWLFRATFHVNTLATSYTETIYGLATLTHTGENITIVSRAAKPGIQFNGFDRAGRVNGQVDVAAASALCPSVAQGVLLPRKLSLDSQGQIANEVVRGSFTFLR